MPPRPAELDQTRDIVDVGLDASPANTDVRPPPSSASGSDSSALFNHGRFLPGTLLADRYRIVALAGSGGMGEVYRADDLRLGQTVALKFLPDRLSKDGPALARFHSEVRLARQISHPNVCRVYDIGEVDGQTFLSMEYIDGEDLAGLLRRIGRFPQDKALEMTRHLVSGLAAAHDKGVLHRDLKPANIMIDGRGKAVLTDFGLAVFIDRHDQLTERAGTPAYMAPEQLEGKGVTARSDLYSLGLILHEIFTGRQVYAGESVADVLKQRLDPASSNNLPSSILPDLDPVIERVIMQCLERDPANRPTSALALLTALPGGNPLAAALAAGETPSPELVAACGKSLCFCPYRAAIACTILLVGLIAIAVLSKSTSAINLMSPEKPPAELAGHARDLLRELGYPPPKDVAYGYAADLGYVPHIQQTDKSADRWGNLKQARTTLSYFWYRQSPAELVPSAFYASPFGNAGVATGQVTGEDPAPNRPGMISVQTDMHGRLLLFRANPIGVATDASTAQKGAIDPLIKIRTSPGGPNLAEAVPVPPVPAFVRSAPPLVAELWQPLFKAAALDTLGITETTPTLPPPVYGDQRKAWLVKSQEDHRELRVEAASLDGKPVYFQVVLPWQATGNPAEVTGRAETPRLILYGQNALLLVAGIFFAWRNLRSGRGDRRGALRLATYVFTILMLAWVLSASHTPSHVELDLLYLGIARALFSAGLVWLFYIALETYVRRLWPEVLISWSRLLAGNWRDSLVGRDVLIGTLAGVTFVVLERLGIALTPLFHLPAAAPVMPMPGTLQGAAQAIGTLLSLHVNSIHVSLFAILLFLLLLRIIFRRPMVAAVMLVVFLTTMMSMMNGHPAVSFIVYGLGLSLMVFVLVRFGLLAVITLLQVRALTLYPITLDTNAWYFGAGALAIALIVSLALYGLFTFMPTRANLLRDDLLATR